MAAEKMRITFVAQGRETSVDVDPSASVGEVIQIALERLDIDGGGSVEWSARTAEGRILDGGKSLIEEGLAGLTRLYIGEHGSGADDADVIADMAGDKERRDMEFKESTPWKDLKCVLTRTIMAMANLSGGGEIIIGIKEVPGRRPDLVGMSKEDFDSYNPDDIASFVNEYAEPSVDVVPRKITSRGKHYVVLDVEEFNEIPIICKKDGRKSCKDHLRRGSIYHRPRHKVESTDRFDHADMRELVGFAATKQHALMHQQCAELYGMGYGGPSPQSPGASGDSRGTGHGGEGGGP